MHTYHYILHRRAEQEPPSNTVEGARGELLSYLRWHDGTMTASQIQPQRDSPCKTDSTRCGPRSFATSHEDTRTDITGENKASLNGGNEKDSLQLLFKQFVGNAVGLGVQSGGQDMVGIPDHAGHGGAIGAFGAHGCFVYVC